ncbi:hypothetical protein AT1G06500 [Arabidopsis thaliana]|jgi:hypothetical protein|uniref:AT1G06500 protein n=1 Tax=Arabidopsis thaliana TaxID=3702 RepID=Q8VY54_ARATH|nr:uncharacterized protein AT1G06500 [Arabidopsis thaliana]NP_001077467.1 uncharacterized protein AT1G06500 [Arabidopsis thaliana]NP_001077468.1 uncharacterized protein AT1G06500 [Arabidopsis thaliana]NP_563767.1 uncharacterized protein AT1G06500 [Arabidopsis thaliana]AAL62427.1 unknown protein [Arabidopsis thaliana]AAM48040.1 unknown protein [Arabidopsis thaliana]AEE27994.1 hypothetical protein AT1G06500 [Arabidopsis thaliana]AEE27995.1 hypothetical protein AT1G06500 [Arabidopsis thaliana]|eukprot:NP_001030980.1 hypothetical protein AT1G06500 [Arabidopsis thaliana]
MMHSTVQHGGNKSGKSNVWANTNLAKTVAAVDEFKFGFPSGGLTTVSNKWWGRAEKGGREDGGGENTENGHVAACDETQNSLVAIRKRIAEEGREAVELGLHQGFGSKRPGKRDQALLFQIFNSAMPKDWVTPDSS